MKKIINWVKENPNRSMFLLPIFLVAGISISHVVSWYDIANPFSWAIYLSIAIEIGAMTALVAATNRIKGGVWFMFGLITLIQMIGNIFYSFKEIDSNGELFKSWVELTGPLWEIMGSDPTDVISMKRWLAFLEGGLLPIISLTSLHFFVKYEKPKDNGEQVDNKSEEKKVWDKVNELKKEGKLPEITEEEVLEEPTSLAFTPYVDEDIIEEEDDDDEQPSLIEEENPEDEVIVTKENEKLVEEDRLVIPLTSFKLRNGGEELSKSWKNVIKKRDNSITRLGE